MTTQPDPSPRRRPARGRALAALALAAALLMAPATAAAEVDDGTLWLLPQYRVPGCEPMPQVPTVFNWLLRKALAVEEFMATSADCGQVGRRGSGEGWSYVFWSESDSTAVAGLLRKAREKYGLTQLLLKGLDETHTIQARGYEAFFLIQLGGNQGPVRVWSAGDVASLEGVISMREGGGLELEVTSRTHAGKECVAKRPLIADAAGGPREALGCR